MPINFKNNMKSSLLIYIIIITIILIQKPKFIFTDKMDLKIIVLSKDRQLSFPILYAVIILGAILAFYIPYI